MSDLSKDRKIVWIHVLTVVSAAILIGAAHEKNLASPKIFLASEAKRPYVRDRPISHVPVAVCRSVGIRTRGRTAARSEIAKTQVRGRLSSETT